MFPVEFATSIVQRFTQRRDSILDPFAGRATSIFAAAVTGRKGFGIEINPVGWLYGATKLRPAPKDLVLARLRQLIDDATDEDRWWGEVNELPRFFTACYKKHVRTLLVAARNTLKWRESRIDRTLMAFFLIYLHGKRGAALSNQMRDGKSFAPAYAIKWWKRKKLTPPHVDVEAFLTKRIEWRFGKGTPPTSESEVKLGDCVSELRRLCREVDEGKRRRFDMIFTSPPYYGVTNYHYDQWLRRWMLGGPDRPKAVHGPWAKRFDDKAAYEKLVDSVFASGGQLLKRSGVIYVRTDAREFTFQTTHDAITKHFPRRHLEIVKQPIHRRSQTALFGDHGAKPGEVDIVVR
jgi:hypothetical protein